MATRNKPSAEPHPTGNNTSYWGILLERFHKLQGWQGVTESAEG